MTSGDVFIRLCCVSVLIVPLDHGVFTLFGSRLRSLAVSWLLVFSMSPLWWICLLVAVPIESSHQHILISQCYSSGVLS